MTKRILIFIYFIFVSSACLITNCPRGGKRGDVELDKEITTEDITGGTIEIVPESNIRDCTSCGPRQLGQCFGPNICCGPTFGCLFNTLGAKLKCQRELNETSPCIAGFANCHGDVGRCAALGVCCSEESCFVDKTCRLADDPTIGPSMIDNRLKMIVNNIELLKKEVQ